MIRYTRYLITDNLSQSAVALPFAYLAIATPQVCSRDDGESRRHALRQVPGNQWLALRSQGTGPAANDGDSTGVWLIFNF